MNTAALSHQLALIERHLPDFRVVEARQLPGGQFNTVLCINDAWIFRFPKSPPAAAELAHELDLLPRLQGKLPLAIPKPQHSAYDPAASAQLLFMAYKMLPGAPLLRDKFAALRAEKLSSNS